jgi:hypothetical protein
MMVEQAGNFFQNIIAINMSVFFINYAKVINIEEYDGNLVFTSDQLMGMIKNIFGLVQPG